MYSIFVNFRKSLAFFVGTAWCLPKFLVLVAKKIFSGFGVGGLPPPPSRSPMGLPAEEHVEGKYRDLTKLLLRLAEFYLKANKHIVDKLTWFNNQVGHFKVAIGGDGAPFGKDDSALAWLVSFLNCGQEFPAVMTTIFSLGQIVLKIVKLLGT